MTHPPQDLPREVYDELYAMANRCLRGERRGHTLQPTALVNEAYLRLAGYGETVWSSRGRFRAIAASCLRHILIQHARERGALKRGGNVQLVSLVDLVEEPASPAELDVLELEEILAELESHDAQMARLIELRYFGGLTFAECAEELELAISTVKDKSRFALAWLRMRLPERD